jgi:hypothetical protein
MMRPRQIITTLCWSLLFWLSFGFVMAWEGVKVLRHGGQVDFRGYLLSYLTGSLAFAVLTPLIFFVVQYRPVRDHNKIRGAAVYLAGSIPFVVLYSCIRWVILPPWSTTQQQFLPRDLHSLFLIGSSYADQIWTYLATVTAAHAYVYMQERAELLRSVASSELQMLKSQIHPHFLFNTLQGISTLIDYDPGKAKAMILMLSNLLRVVLRSAQTDLIALHEELTLIENYVAIEKIRFGDRLQVRWAIESGATGLLVPQLILQPLLENAIVHGVASSREGGWIEIAAEKHEDVLEICISNSLRSERRYQGSGVGLRNARGRLKYFFGDEAGLDFRIEEGRLAKATLKLPALKGALETAGWNESRVASAGGTL